MTHNVNNHPAVEERHIKNYAAALVFARQLRAMNKGTQIERDKKDTVLKSMMANYGLSTADARSIYRAARKAE